MSEVNKLKYDLGLYTYSFTAYPKIIVNELNCSGEISKIDNTVQINGSIDNLHKPIECTLEWLIKRTDVTDENLYEAKVSYTNNVLIYPIESDGFLKNKKFEIRDIKTENEQGLKLNVFEYDIYGEGKIGFRITPLKHLGFNNIELLPESSSLKLNLPCDLNAKQSLFSNNQKLLIGSVVDLSLNIADAFKDYNAELIIKEDDQDKEVTNKDFLNIQKVKEFIIGKETVFNWAIGLNDDNTMMFGNSLEADNELEFSYSIKIKMKKDDKEISKILKPNKKFLTVPQPELDTFKISYTPFLKLKAEIKIKNIFSIIPLLFQLSLYKYIKKDGAERKIVCLPNLAKKIILIGGEYNGEIGSVVDIKGANFDMIVLRDPVFAVLELQKDAIPKNTSSILAYLINYKPSMTHEEGDELGFAPFKDGEFSVKELASGICTDLLYINGKVEDLESDSLEIPEDKISEYRMFIAVIFAEAQAQSELAWKAIAWVIMNRRKDSGITYKTNNSEERNSVKNIITANKQFEGITSNSYKNALTYLETGKKKNLDEDQIEIVDKMYELLKGIYLKKEVDDISNDAVLYYSPNAQRKLGRSKPAFARGEGVKQLVDVTSLVLGEDYDKKVDDFIFFKYK